MIKLKMMEKLPLRRYTPQGKPFPGEVRPLGRSDLIKGQALLIVLLVMAVGLTIGLSVISRSVTDIRISQQTEEAARAFSAAEAGIESALVGGSLEGTFSETGASYQAAAVGIGGGPEFAFDQYDTNSPQVLWLANYQDLSKGYDRDAIRIMWGNDGTPANTDNTPALEVSLYYKDGLNYKVAKWALDPNAGRSNSFYKPCPPGCPSDIAEFITTGDTAEGKKFQFRGSLRLSSFAGAGKTLLFARLRLLYAPDNEKHGLGAKAVGTILSGTGDLPSQGTRIDSVGTAGTATRKVQVVRSHPVPPAIFDSVLYSEGGLVKP